eukprot:gene2798-1783_t
MLLICGGIFYDCDVVEVTLAFLNFVMYPFNAMCITVAGKAGLLWMCSVAYAPFCFTLMIFRCVVGMMNFNTPSQLFDLLLGCCVILIYNGCGFDCGWLLVHVGVVLFVLFVVHVFLMSCLWVLFGVSMLHVYRLLGLLITVCDFEIRIILVVVLLRVPIFEHNSDRLLGGLRFGWYYLSFAMTLMCGEVFLHGIDMLMLGLAFDAVDC